MGRAGAGPAGTPAPHVLERRVAPACPSPSARFRFRPGERDGDAMRAVPKQEPAGGGGGGASAQGAPQLWFPLPSSLVRNRRIPQQWSRAYKEDPVRYTQ